MSADDTDQEKLLLEIQQNIVQHEREKEREERLEDQAFEAASRLSKDAMVSNFLEGVKAWKLDELDQEAIVHEANITELKANAAGDEGGSKTLWLISFTDIVALMLTFFVLLYSMSVPQQTQWENMVQSIDSVVVPHKTLRDNAGEFDFISIKKIETRSALDLNYLMNILRTQLQQQGALDRTLLMRGRDRVIISLPASLTFDSGQQEINAEGLSALAGISEVFSRISNRIEVVGHADPAPIAGGPYLNNWELSLARAINVATFLKQAGYDREVVVRGAADSRFEFSNQETISEELQKQMARRVDIVVMRDNGKPYVFAPGLGL